MKDVSVLSSKKISIKNSDVYRAIIYHLACAVIGFLLCRAVFFEKYMPFGIAFIGAASPTYLPSAAIGVFIGYFIPGIGFSGFRYVAATLAVLAVRFIISFNKKLTTSPLFSGIICSAALSVTSAVAYGGMDADILYLSLEVIALGGAAMVFNRTVSFIAHIYTGLSPEELGCLMIVINIVLGGMYRISLFGVSLGGILAAALILSTSKYGGIIAGVSSGVTAALMTLFAGRDAQLCLIYAVCALTAGLVTSLGKYIELCSFFICAVSLSLLLEPTSKTAAFITEMLIGCIIFAILPKSVGIRLSKIFTCFPQISVNNDLNRAVTMRLKEAAAGIKDVKITVDEVASRLEGLNTPGFSSVLTDTESEACVGCKWQSNCWQAKRENTLENIFIMIKTIKANGTLSPSALPEEFKGKCLRREKFCEALTKSYLSFASFTEANGRIQQIRQAIGDQFEGIASMLDELALDFSNGVTFDNAAALTAVTALKNIGIVADECSAPVDKYGRMKINLKLFKANETVLNKRDIMRVLSLACERNFSPPVIKKTAGETFISISERARLRIDIGVCQKSAAAGDLCGDAYSYFSDGSGHFIMILSDGMGTGSRAAVDSAMASNLMSRLIKSGFGFDCALSILNSSMLFKSTDESLATVDIASIDLFSGETEFYKAGAAPSIVRRSGRTGKAASTSLPIGILSDVAFDKAEIKLSSGDILVLISDGASFDGTEWLRDETERFSNGTAQDLADRLCELAASRRRDAHTDDITVMTAVIS